MTCWPEDGTKAYDGGANGAPPRSRGILGNDAHRSAAHQMGNRLAYDKLLMQACGMLEIEHDLDGDSIGFERDIERIRIEAELERAGVILSDRRFGQAA